jgi:hypothetical protein
MVDATLKIDKAVIQSTVNCKHDFRCLSGDKSCLCEVKESIGYDMLKIEPKSDVDFSHLISLGKTNFCNCPTRIEIYNRYKI